MVWWLLVLILPLSSSLYCHFYKRIQRNRKFTNLKIHRCRKAKPKLLWASKILKSSQKKESVWLKFSPPQKHKGLVKSIRWERHALFVFHNPRLSNLLIRTIWVKFVAVSSCQVLRAKKPIPSFKFHFNRSQFWENFFVKKHQIYKWKCENLGVNSMTAWVPISSVKSWLQAVFWPNGALKNVTHNVFLFFFAFFLLR